MIWIIWNILNSSRDPLQSVLLQYSKISEGYFRENVIETLLHELVILTSLKMMTAKNELNHKYADKCSHSLISRPQAIFGAWHCSGVRVVCNSEAVNYLLWDKIINSCWQFHRNEWNIDDSFCQNFPSLKLLPSEASRTSCLDQRSHNFPL